MQTYQKKTIFSDIVRSHCTLLKMWLTVLRNHMCVTLRWMLMSHENHSHRSTCIPLLFHSGVKSTYLTGQWVDCNLNWGTFQTLCNMGCFLKYCHIHMFSTLTWDKNCSRKLRLESWTYLLRFGISITNWLDTNTLYYNEYRTAELVSIQVKRSQNSML